MQIKLKGNKLAPFLADWDMILAGFPEDPMKSDHKQTRDAIERIFYDELCKSDDMKEICPSLREARSRSQRQDLRVPT